MDNSTVLSSNDTSVLAAILGLGIGVIVALLIFTVLMYVFTALGFYTLAKRQGISYAWIAWIPICQLYLLGDLIGNELWGFGYTNWILVLLPFVTSILDSMTSSSGSFMTTIAWIISAIAYVYNLCAYYKLFKIYRPQSAMLFTISGAILPFLISIYVFIIRNSQRNSLPTDSRRN